MADFIISAGVSRWPSVSTMGIGNGNGHDHDYNHGDADADGWLPIVVDLPSRIVEGLRRATWLEGELLHGDRGRVPGYGL